MRLPIEQILHIADLARLEITPEEAERYREQLSAILDYFQQLQSIDTQAISPTTSGVTLDTTLRTDFTLPGLRRSEAFANAAEIDQDQFHVPPVFD